MSTDDDDLGTKRRHEENSVTEQTMDPIHPGEVLQEEYLTPLGITQHKLAVSVGVPPRRINEIAPAAGPARGRRPWATAASGR